MREADRAHTMGGACVCTPVSIMPAKTARKRSGSIAPAGTAGTSSGSDGKATRGRPGRRAILSGLAAALAAAPAIGAEGGDGTGITGPGATAESVAALRFDGLDADLTKRLANTIGNRFDWQDSMATDHAMILIALSNLGKNDAEMYDFVETIGLRTARAYHQDLESLRIFYESLADLLRTSSTRTLIGMARAALMPQVAA